MKVLIFALLSSPLFAQPKVEGLGKFRIGITTPDSISASNFREQEPPVVKGTLTLVCANIRLFKADAIEIQGVFIPDLFLVFYENRLFRITCAYNDLLEKAFGGRHGKGKTGSVQTLVECDKEKNRRLTLESESWQADGILTLVVHARGYNVQCQHLQSSRLTIASQSILAITSECDLEHLDPYLEKIPLPH
ncbi:hypothetical protein [Larkinella rosea]|uniref:Uncharacterized protein n=1 Tax=Larkinella rosea TaxID=2025312 RepID=A0A3P1BUL6_9BACT|nr:hypothetical protein [Larkinella rosea]RRB04702.1 hypothetical protein EHT25_14625 [Larkinella rosea]